MDYSILEWFNIQAGEIIYRLYSEGVLFDLIFPKADLSKIELFSQLFEQQYDSFNQAVQEVTQKKGDSNLYYCAPTLLKAKCRGVFDKRHKLKIKVEEVRQECLMETLG